MPGAGSERRALLSGFAGACRRRRGLACVQPHGEACARLRPVSDPAPSFAGDRGTARYYDMRAAEYDDWYVGAGAFAERERPGWQRELARLTELVSGLAPARTLDIACGTGFLTRHLRGFAVGVDQSSAMVAIAQSRLPHGLAVVGDALAVGMADLAFDRVFTAHFYGHLPPPERSAFLAEARRLAPQLVVVDSAMRAGVAPEGWQRRVLDDGSEHRVYKRYLSASQLAQEIGGSVLLDGDWFVAAEATAAGPPPP